MTTATRRGVDLVVAPPRVHWVGDGFRVAGYFSGIPDAERRLDPFLLFDYGAPHAFPPTDNLRRGVGPHPHAQGLERPVHVARVVGEERLGDLRATRGEAGQEQRAVGVAL